MKYPFLVENIVLVDGPEATGVYDLNKGSFQRVTLQGGRILKSLDGTLEFSQLNESSRKFVESAAANNLVLYQNEAQVRPQTALSSVVRSHRSVRFAWIEITSKCNQKCLHCFLGSDLNRFKYQPKEKVFSHIDALVKRGVSQIVISGGEPTTHPDIEAILRYACQYPINVTLLTNGSNLRSRSLAPLLRELSVNVKIPILGWRESHDRMAGLPGGFKKTIKTIHHYVREGVAIELGTTVTSINLSDIPRIRRYANRVRLPLEVSPIFAIGYARDNRDVLMAHPQSVITQACKTDKEKAITNVRPRPQPTRMIRPKNPTDYQSVDLKGYLTDSHECGQKIVAVLSSGRVTPCLLLREPAESMGDTNFYQLDEILDPQFAHRKAFDRAMKLKNVVECRDCEARYACKAGGCPATSKAFNGQISSRNPMYKSCYYKHRNATVGANVETSE